ncbi:MAG: AAA family ATPase [Bacteroidetes bacterium]|nr:AAA family ATPase [Bacteroidota bacterium]MBL7104058.1 AAA family ATPase [Bacteroidales bacterium]
METENIIQESERRQATVMFADISGFTTLSEKMDPEEVTFIMNDCFEMMGSIIKHYGGTIDKFIGDCIMILFGVPVAVEDAPQKAVNTAVEIRNQLNRCNKEKKLSIPLDVHIGINTGSVVSGPVGSSEKKEYTVIGDTVNIASRLKDLSNNGQIYVGPLTHKYTENDFEYQMLEPIMVKGRQNPVQVYELLSTKVKIERSRFDFNRMIHSEMIGRKTELDRLELHVLKAINGEGSVVSIIGEAGIGKSRLIAELRKKDEMKRVIYLVGRSLSIGRNLNYHPIIDIFRNWANIKDTDTTLQSVNKLEKAISMVDPYATEEILPFVATLMGISLTGKYAKRIQGIEGEALEKLILVSLRKLIIKASAKRPVVLVIEDLHWSDLTSIELFESLYRLAENNPILFINVMRPNFEESGNRILKTLNERCREYHSEFYLEPLNHNQCEVLINNLLKIKGLPGHVRDIITNRAEGNPFFIEEVIRSFIDNSVVEVKDGKFEVTEKIESVVIPETIQGVLMSRIDRLNEQTKSLLKVASVIGRNFFYKILVEVAKTTQEIDEKLEYLKGIQLIKQGSRVSELEYLFRHVLAQEVTYETILLKKRKDLHLRTANAIELVFAERLHEFYGMLAFHYSQGEDLEKAEEYLVKAGEEALKAAASSEAINYYQQALGLYLKKHKGSGDPETIANLEKNIAIAFFNKGRYTEAVEHFDKVLQLWGEKFPKNRVLLYSQLVWNILILIKSLYLPSKKAKKIPEPRDNEIINIVAKKAYALSQMDIKRMFIEFILHIRRFFHYNVAQIDNGTSVLVMQSGAFSLGGISFKISKKILDYSGDYINREDVTEVVHYKCIETINNFLSGNWLNELQFDKSLIDQAFIIGANQIITHAYTFWYCLQEIEQGKFNNAEELITKLYEFGKEYDNDLALARKYMAKTKLLIKHRMFHEAMTEAEYGISLLNRIGLVPFGIYAKGMKAYIQLLSKDMTEAEQTLSLLSAELSGKGRITPFHKSSFLRSRFLFDLMMLEDTNNLNDRKKRSLLRKNACKSGKSALKNSLKVACEKPEIFKLMGIYYWLAGNRKRALKWWNKSIQIGEQLGARPELTRTYIEVGKRLLEKKGRHTSLNNITAEEFFGKAEVLFKEMDLKWDMEELEKIKFYDR